MSSAAISSTWRSTFTNVPPLTKTISTAMTVMTTLGLLLRFRDMAMLNYADQDAPNTDPSSSFTNAEATLIPLLALVPVSGKYLERAWGSRELFKFLAVTSVGTMLGIYFTCLFEYIVRGNEDILYKTQAYGLTAVLSGFLVGFKQLVPEHLVTLWGIFSVRVKTLPMLFAVFMIFESLITRSQIQLMMAIYGMFISWVYSRFFKVQDGIRGDRSETFSFASFFPEAAQPLVKPLSNIVFGILVRLRICSPLGFGAGFQQDLENPGMILPLSQPASLRAEAERRRALALKALDMRLHAAAGNSANLPGLSQKTFLGPTPSAGSPISFPSISKEAPPTNKPNMEGEVLFETTALDEGLVETSDRSQETGSSIPHGDNQKPQ
ncbi:hypothetical protein BGZ80_010898 [Entomortierella chlamydospora]|uniref:Rhomboid family protein n=1 Tax=Entomortierella chlamydospora TaxID=101097 RepID=A0A9P6N427_9FUNG|nr:hypothetical protein BGZ79_008669 [Entomortierella chlamydospora]KAG0022902.1 hypothetical protein BGZ80_010898 [Entomortierella chlamydospora]